MSNELKEGVKLKSIIGLPSPDGTIYATVGEEPYRCKEIIVVEQQGHVGMVPWAKAIFNDGNVQLFNLANIESVALMDGEYK